MVESRRVIFFRTFQYFVFMAELVLCKEVFLKTNVLDKIFLTLRPSPVHKIKSKCPPHFFQPANPEKNNVLSLRLKSWAATRLESRDLVWLENTSFWRASRRENAGWDVNGSWLSISRWQDWAATHSCRGCFSRHCHKTKELGEPGVNGWNTGVQKWQNVQYFLMHH